MIAVADIPIIIERTPEETLQSQIVQQLRSAVFDGRLATGVRLPSTRALADSLGVSRNTIVLAYEHLAAEGYLITGHGSGTFVASDIPDPSTPQMPEPTRQPRWLPDADLPWSWPQPDARTTVDFRLGRPDVPEAFLPAWRRAWRQVAAELPPRDYGDPAGLSRLRHAIADYLRRSRSVACQSDDIVVTSGASQSIELIVRATGGAQSSIAIENPGYPNVWQLLRMHRLPILPIPVDEGGLDIDQLPTGDDVPMLLYVTPSHQYPLGARLSVGRRIALLEWARQHDVLIIEDDYDSEFRYDASPLPSLASLDTDGRVAYVGTISKVISPSLRIGYLAAPRPLRERIVQIRRHLDYHTSWPLQRALVELIEQGDLERHIRRMRRLYAEKRSVLQLGLKHAEPWAWVEGIEAGLHAFLHLDDSVPADALIERLREQGVLVNGLRDYGTGPLPNGVLLGYGGVSIPDIAKGSTIISETAHQLAHLSRRLESVLR